LRNFSMIFTTNYDLLLYWALLSAGQKRAKIRDGFSRYDDSYLVIGSIDALESANLFYLHGGLHLFESEHKILKRKYRDGHSALEQMSNAIKDGQFPLVVAEGESQQKQNKINSNAYLSKCQQIFTDICNEHGVSLFIFGHSLSENDEHILSIIPKGKIEQIFVSMHRENGKSYKQLRRRASELEDERDALKVTLFDAESANVWGKIDKTKEH